MSSIILLYPKRCRIGKAGTSTWMYILARALGMMRDNDGKCNPILLQLLTNFCNESSLVSPHPSASISHDDFIDATDRFLTSGEKLDIMKWACITYIVLTPWPMQYCSSLFISRTLTLDGGYGTRTYRSFMIYRHPIDRLYSAFVNKIQSKRM